MNPDTWSTRGLLAVWSVLLFAVCFTLYTRHNRFPYYYHPDETGKVEQILTGERNYHHPMLLLTVTAHSARLTATPRTEQAIVECGRTVSAAFMAIGVVAISLLAFLWKGWAPGLFAGAALAAHHQLYELAHYFKEDSALFMGVACAFLAAFAYTQTPSVFRAAVLGAACALAVSGKYIGAVALAVAVPALWIAKTNRRSAQIAVWFGAFLLALALLNLPMLLNLGSVGENLGREVDLVVHGQGGMTRSVPHAQYWNIFVDNTTPVIWLLLAAFLVARWRERRSIPPIERLMLLFPFAYALALSFSPKSNDRYFLPATAMLVLLAALATRDVMRWAAPRVLPRNALYLVGAILVLAQVPSFLRYESAFRRDDNQELIAWLRTAVAPSAVLAKDGRIALPDPKRKKHAARMGVVPQKIIAEKYAADLGTLEELRTTGVTHVAVSESDYGRFFLRSLRPQKGGETQFNVRRTFYEQLLREGDLVFDRDRGTVIYLHPGIKVYQIAPVKG